jgi:hypothetical protein
MKKIILGSLCTLMLMVSMTAIATPQAEAACVYPGYTNSKGQCVQTYTNHNYPLTISYSYQNNQINDLQAQIFQLLAMLEQLQNLQAERGFTNVSGNSDVEVTTRSAIDVEDEDAKLRGEVDFNNEDEVTVYFQFGKSSTNLRYNTTHFVLDEDDDDEDFEHGITDLDDDTRYYYRAVAEDENGRRDFGKILSFTTDDSGGSNSDDDPSLDADNATSIDEDSAVLHGSVDMNDFRNGLVFFVYGEDEDQVDDIASDYDEYGDIDEDGDDLQKVKVDSDLDGDEDYNYTARYLNEDQRIYFSICVEYEDEDDDQVIKCSSAEDFSTDGSSSSDDEPDIATVDYSYVTDYSARMSGSVDMNDFNNGIVFIVYGEDEDQVDDIASDYDEYGDIDEDGVDLQKIKVRSDVDDDLNFYATTNGLDNDTEIYFAACVEYEDEDNDDVVVCGGTKSFTTDN